MQQIAMRSMELDGIEAEARGAAGRGSKSLSHARQPVPIERHGRVVTCLERDR
jgi:hypothetical protein